MIRHVIALIAVVLAGWALFFMANLDKEANKFQKIDELIKKTSAEDKKLGDRPKITKTVSKPQTTTPAVEQKNEMNEKLKALREKAGNMAAFKVSPLYKKSCASCHGQIGEGIIGPKLIGRSKEFVLGELKKFKSGKRKNYVMYGLLGHMSDEQLESLSTEIATFQSKLEAAQK